MCKHYDKSYSENQDSRARSLPAKFATQPRLGSSKLAGQLNKNEVTLLHLKLSLCWRAKESADSVLPQLVHVAS